MKIPLLNLIQRLPASQRVRPGVLETGAVLLAPNGFGLRERRSFGRDHCNRVVVRRGVTAVSGGGEDIDLP